MLHRPLVTLVLAAVGLLVAPRHYADAGTQQQEIPNTQALSIPMTPPTEALKKLNLPDGFRATLFAAEPDVHQPIAVAFDTQGRLWVVECYTYSDRAENFNTKLNDRVVIFADSDNDGVFDSRKIFWDQGKRLTGIELGFGGVWLTSAPNLIFVPDANADDIPDGPPKTLLNGFENDRVRHNIVNGLRWGPDGWLYGRHGIQATSLVGPPGATSSQRTSLNCCIWRFHPISKTFEVVAEGGTNPWGFDFDRHGEMFMINTVIGHLFHVVPGARFARMYGAHFNPHTYQVIEQTADHVHWDTNNEGWAAAKKSIQKSDSLSDATDKAGGGHAHCGLMIYQGDNWPNSYRDKLYTANFHGRRINSDTIHREGNGYVGHHGADHFGSDDPWFRGVELVSGPDGGVFLLDWSDIGECHENDGIHRTSGRIFKIAYGEKTKPTSGNLNKFSNQKLIELLEHKDQWFVRKSRRLLQERFTAGTDDEANAKTARQLQAALHAADNVDLKLRLLWTMYSCELLDATSLLEASKHADEHVRSWAVRFLTDGRIPISDTVVERLVELGRTDDSGLVRLYLAAGLKRLNARQAFQLASALTSHATDADDRTQPHMIWYGIEPHVIAHPELAVQLFIDSKIPLLQENIGRRLLSEIDKHPGLAELVLKAGISTTNAATRQHLLTGADKALAGWNHATAPQAWNNFQHTVRSDAFHQGNTDRMQRMNLVFGDQLTIDDLYKTINDGSASHQARCNAIESVGRLKPDERLFKTLKSSIRHRELTNSVIRAMAELPDQQIPSLLLKQFKSMDSTGHQLTVDLLSTRLTFANKLLDAIGDGRIPKHMLTASHARRLANFDDVGLSKKLTKTWGLVGLTSAEQNSAIETFRETFTKEKIAAADIAVGKTLFETHCASCHVMRGQGGRIGPDLTGSDRKNLHYLLENILAPSSSVADSYRASVVAMEDGRLLEGIIVSKNDRILKLQTKDDLLSIDLNDVAATTTTKRSLMPEDLLKPLSERETASLFKYLQN